MMFLNVLFLFRVGLRPVLFVQQLRGFFFVSQNPSDQWMFFAFGPQRAKKVASDSPGLVDFAVGLVIFVLNLLFLGEIQITEGL